MSPVPTTFPALVLPRFGRTRPTIVVLLTACVLWLASSVVAAGTARAAERDPEADVPAAMCDPVGASVAVPPDMDLPLVDRGRFEQLPCEALAFMLRAHLREAPRGHHAVTGDPERPEQPPREVERPRQDGARTLGVALPSLVEPLDLDATAMLGIAARRGHHRAVYRPPLQPVRA